MPSSLIAETPNRQLSNALVTATISSVQDTVARLQDDTHLFNASAVATLRLTATMFEHFFEIGESDRMAAKLQANQGAFLDYRVSLDDAKTIQSHLAAAGLKKTTDQIISKLNPTIDERRKTIDSIASTGMRQYQWSVVHAMSSSLLDARYTGLAPAGMQRTPSKYGGHFLNADYSCGLDQWQCRVIGMGAAFGCFTGNPGGLVLAVWAAYCCV